MVRQYEDVHFYTQTHPDVPIRVVAAVNRGEDECVFDWAVYIGCAPIGTVARDGVKLTVEQAMGFFPHLPIGLYRE